MATEIKMPDLGTTVDQVKVLRWIKQVGDAVKRGDPLCEVETDKATSELESHAEGYLLWQCAPEGSEVDAGAVIAYVGEKGEAAPTENKLPDPTSSEAASAAAPAGSSGAASSAPRVSMLLKNLAQKEGVDLSSLKGTGPAGTITRDDVLAAAKAKSSAPAAAGASLSSNQRSVARRVSQSWRQIVPIQLNAVLDLRPALALRNRLKQEKGKAPSFDAIFVKATADAVNSSPRFRCWLDDEKIIEFDGTHIAVAVSCGDDLFLPVVKNAPDLSLEQIQARLDELVQKGRSGALTAGEMDGACFTVSNLGMFPIESFSMIIPPGQSASLSIGTGRNELAMDGDRVVERLVVTVSLTVDHRLINGRQAAEFLTALKSAVENL